MKWIGNKHGACGDNYYRISFREWISLLFGKSVNVQCIIITLFGGMPK